MFDLIFTIKDNVTPKLKLEREAESVSYPICVD